MNTQSLRTAVTISLASSPRFANRRTLLISLVLTPILSTLMLVAIVGSIAGTDLRTTAYASVLVSAFISVLGSINASLAYERLTKIIPEALFPRFGTPTYWLAKMILPVLAAALVALTSIGAVYLIDPAMDASAATRAIVVLPTALLSGALVGLATGVLSLLFSDPYLISNVLSGILPLTAGVAAPLTSYPTWLQVIAEKLPMAWTIEAMRSDLNILPWELVTCLPWVVAGLVAVVLARRRLRDGRDVTFI